MVDKIFVKPDEVRGLGNIVSPSKTLDDFTGYSCNLTFQDDEYTMTYESNERVWVDTGSGSYNYGEAVDLSAHINTKVAGLTMQFFDGETLIGEATTDSNGEALTWITTLSAGVHIITAKCKGITSSNSARVTIILEYDGFEIIETSNKTILSAYDEEYAVFHVQLTLDGEPVAKQGVSVNWYKDNVLVSTKSTMSSGWCEFGYDAVGAGDITFRADVNINGMLVSKTYGVQDYYYFDPQTTDKNRYTVTSGGASISYSSDGVTITGTQATDTLVKNTALTLPTSYSAEVTLSELTSGDYVSGIGYAYGGLCFDNCLIDMLSGSINVYTLSPIALLTTINQGVSNDDVLKIVMENGTMSIYKNNSLLTTQSVSHTGVYQHRTYKSSNKAGRSITAKDLKIKPL